MRSDYTNWLRRMVRQPDYDKLIDQLDETPFVWFFEADKNRAEGGLNLRSKYAYETSTDEEDVRTGDCTVLEMLISLAEHMTDQIMYVTTKDCFWMLIRNLGLMFLTDDEYDPETVEMMLGFWLNRDYDPKGYGSLFPLKKYSGDCRNIDIWTQMNAWINENYPPTNNWMTYAT